MASKTYNGTDISIEFDMKRCIHARNCFLKLPKVFDPAQRPWVQPDNAPAEEIAAMVRTCPSGALKFTMKTGAAEEPPQINRIAVLENGPLGLAGGFGRRYTFDIVSVRFVQKQTLLRLQPRGRKL